MIPELGHFALILALLVAAVQGVVPLFGAHTRDAAWMAVARPAAYTQLFLVLFAFVALSHAFATQDFSVVYVANNSNSQLPMMYRLSAVWGSHEGSLLLWTLILSLWTAAVARFSKSLPEAFAARVIAVMGLVAVGFMLFMLFTSNPFERHIPALIEGRDLNPLLQDPGLIIHPPMLYIGYVGFAVPFAFAIAALLSGQLDAGWARWSRPWTLVSWSFLTLGIALGSWWAYYELGWGGWWFWDPVENASFMPWLAGTALIHSQAVTEKRGAFRSWTVLLSITAFALSLLGTFLVRSGVLTSVHAFANDPARGLFILVYLLTVIGGALTLYAWRAPRVASPIATTPMSRETFLLINNLFFAVAAATVLLGTLYPLVIDALGLGKISVGPPYFGFMFAILMAPVVALMPAAPYVRWKTDEPGRVAESLWKPLAIAVAIAALLLPLYWSGLSLFLLGGVLGGSWVMVGTLWYAVARFRTRPPGRFRLLPAGEMGMILAHFGVGIFVLGVTITNTFSVEQDIRLAPGEEYELAGHVFRFETVETLDGPNYTAAQGTFLVSRGNDTVAMLYPQKRRYPQGNQMMTEAAIKAGFTRDIYVSLGEPLSDGAWSVRIYYKPFIRWIWLGALFMMAGGFVAAFDKRYRRTRAAAAEHAAPRVVEQGTAPQGA